MKRLGIGVSTFLVLALCPSISAFADIITLETTPAGLGSNDSTSWSQLGADATTLTGPFSATSGLGVGVTGNFNITPADNTGLVAVVCPSAPSCSWTTSGTGMNAGDTDIWAFDPNAAGGSGAGTGPLSLAFSSGLFGAGAYIEGDTGGQYTAAIQAFGVSGSLGAAQTVTSDGSGDPVFIGLLDSTAADITKIQFSLTSCASGCTNLGDFAIDTLQMTDATSAAPEPSSLLLLGGGLFGMGWALRRKSLKA